MAKAAITLDELAPRLAQISNAIEQDILQLHKEVTRAIHYEVIYRTPVDVGTARSNWLVAVGAGFRAGTIRAFFPFPSRWKNRTRLRAGGSRAARGAGGTRAENSNLLAAQLAGVTALNGLQYSNNMSTTIANNLPYIGRLAQGYSKQSAAGLIVKGVSAGTNSAFKAFRWRNLKRLSG